EGAAHIWFKIHELVQENPDLKDILSGIHFSITMHICKFYYQNGDNFEPNLVLYKRKRKNEYIENLYYAYAVIRNAICFYKDDILKSSTALKKKERKLIHSFLDAIYKVSPININKFIKLKSLSNINKIINISNYIKCDKCRLWGKLQFNGLKTAFLMHAGNYDNIKFSVEDLIYLLHLFNILASSMQFVKELDAALKK
ncbi:endoplasmic oxidoreductin-1, partial [Conglomerata obtusa]